MSQFEANHKMEYVKLLDLLAKAVSVTKVSSISDVDERRRLGDAHKLANKFVEHASTILHLSNGTVVKGLPSFKEFIFIDTASIDVLTRAAFEAFCVFYFVFYIPNTEEEKDFRYWTHRATGLAERQDLPAIIFEHKHQKLKEKKIFEEICEKLESNIIFKSITEKMQTRFIKGKERDLWRWNQDDRKILSWPDIAINAGLSEMLASHMYKHLSGYAHSGSLSVLQTAQALINKDTARLIQSSIDTMNVLIANMIQEYCGLFSDAQSILISSGESDFVQVWIKVGRSLD